MANTVTIRELQNMPGFSNSIIKSQKPINVYEEKFSQDNMKYSY